MAGAEGTHAFVCAQCGRKAVRPYRGSGVKPSLCGDACKMQAYYARHGIKRGRALARQAEALRVRVRVEMAGKRQVQGPPQPRRCNCGAFIMGKWFLFCSECSAERAKAVKARHRKAGKVRRRGAKAESVDLRLVLERDGWRCRMCGRKTPERLRGTFDPRAPEVDHIVPIAAGGEHSYRNTQCACRACNIAKGSTPLGQMRLF